MASHQRYRLTQLAEHIGAELSGDADCEIGGIASLDSAMPGQISFLSDPAYVACLETTRASAVIVAPDQAAAVSGNALVTANPYLGYARISRLFDDRPVPGAGIAPSASIASTAQIHESACIAPQAVIEDGAVIAAGVEIGAGTYVGHQVQIGEDSRIAANVTLHHGVILGKRVIIHSGAVIGADGFGFANDCGVWDKIAQLGGVRIGDDVEIGACTSVDRGALQDTVIEEGVKIDNQVMVAHNVHIGAHTAIAGCVGISGSTHIGRHCTLAGGVGLVGHIRLADHVFVTGMTMVTKSIDQPGAYSSGTPMMPTGQWKKNSVRMRQLDKMFKRLQELERQVEQLKEQANQ